MAGNDAGECGACIWLCYLVSYRNIIALLHVRKYCAAYVAGFGFIHQLHIFLRNACYVHYIVTCFACVLTCALTISMKQTFYNYLAPRANTWNLWPRCSTSASRSDTEHPSKLYHWALPAMPPIMCFIDFFMERCPMRSILVFGG